MDIDYSTRGELADIVLNLISLNLGTSEFRSSLGTVINQFYAMGYEGGYRDGCN